MNNFKTNNLMIDENGIWDIETGEKLDIKIEDIVKIKEKQVNNLLGDLSVLGEKDYVLIKHKGNKVSCINIKPSYSFGKLFRVLLKSIIKKEVINKNMAAFMFYVFPYVYFPDNNIILNNKIPTIEDLSKHTGFSKRTINTILNELEKIDFIKRIKQNIYSIIYVNPFIYCNGLIKESTYNLFEDSAYNPDNIVVN